MEIYDAEKLETATRTFSCASPRPVAPIETANATAYTITFILMMGPFLASESLTQRRNSSQCEFGPPYNFGMRSVLLIIVQPLTKNNSDSGCQCTPAISTTPSGRLSPVRPKYTHVARMATRIKLDGIGVPSKYLTLPAASASCPAVTLLRASRLM